MDLLGERWSAAAARPGVRIVRIHAEENEKQMVQTFYTWLLGVDTPNKDIPVIFETIFHDPGQYTGDLLKETEELLDIWNNANSDALAEKPQRINWKPDYTLTQKGNSAFPFVANMNRLAAYLALDKGIYLTLILKVSFVEPREFTKWLELMLKAGLSDKVRVVVDDSTDHPFYKKIAASYPAEIFTLLPRLDMDNAMQQVASMGNPDDPTVLYRRSFVQLMQAIEKRKEREARLHAEDCIAIATANISVNAYWIGQHIAVYAALANDQVGYKNYKKAIAYATEGVQAAEKSTGLIADEFVCRKFMAQAIMLRGSLYAADRRWKEAIADFEQAAQDYTYTNDVILSMEAWRMTAYANRQSGYKNAACKALAAAMKIARNIPSHILRFTTFPGVVEMLLAINNNRYIDRVEVEELATHVYGQDWMREIRSWKSPQYESVEDATKTVVV